MRLIIVDGLDAVGKDTHGRMIGKRYCEMGERVMIRSHPESDNFFGRKAKKALLGTSKLNTIQASVFYMLDVLRSVRHYYRNPQYDTLIMVRYLMGTAYLPIRFAKIAYRFFEHFVPTSEYMFFLDAPPEVLLSRVSQREKKELFETAHELLKVRKKALLLAKQWHIIDTTASVEETFSEISGILKTLDQTGQ
jgi:dTMP kinase